MKPFLLILIVFFFAGCTTVSNDHSSELRKRLGGTFLVSDLDTLDTLYLKAITLDINSDSLKINPDSVLKEAEETYDYLKSENALPRLGEISDKQREDFNSLPKNEYVRKYILPDWMRYRKYNKLFDIFANQRFFDSKTEGRCLSRKMIIQRENILIRMFSELELPEQTIKLASLIKNSKAKYNELPIAMFLINDSTELNWILLKSWEYDIEQPTLSGENPIADSCVSVGGHIRGDIYDFELDSLLGTFQCM